MNNAELDPKGTPPPLGPANAAAAPAGPIHGRHARSGKPVQKAQILSENLRQRERAITPTLQGIMRSRFTRPGAIGEATNED